MLPSQILAKKIYVYYYNILTFRNSSCFCRREWSRNSSSISMLASASSCSAFLFLSPKSCISNSSSFTGRSTPWGKQLHFPLSSISSNNKRAKPHGTNAWCEHTHTHTHRPITKGNWKRIQWAPVEGQAVVALLEERCLLIAMPMLFSLTAQEWTAHGTYISWRSIASY